MRKINLVVIGYGGMGGWHVQHALNSDTVNLLGIYDILPEKRALAESITAKKVIPTAKQIAEIKLCVRNFQRLRKATFK